jgi:hypothetical protein
MLAARSISSIIHYLVQYFRRFNEWIDFTIVLTSSAVEFREAVFFKARIV